MINISKVISTIVFVFGVLAIFFSLFLYGNISLILWVAFLLIGITALIIGIEIHTEARADEVFNRNYGLLMKEKAKDIEEMRFSIGELVAEKQSRTDALALKQTKRKKRKPKKSKLGYSTEPIVPLKEKQEKPLPEKVDFTKKRKSSIFEDE
jgi:cell division protein FtsL